MTTDIKYLDPKADLTFKKIFCNHPDLLMSFLNALLPLSEDQQIQSIEKQKAVHIAKNLKTIGMDVNTIREMTGLTKEEIEKYGRM